MNKLLILDLDQTLIHSQSNIKNPFLDGRGEPNTQITRDGETFYFWSRPFLREFLLHVSEKYKLAVYSASTEAYAQFVVEKFFPEEVGANLLFIWGQSMCESRVKFIPERRKAMSYHVKNLGRVSSEFSIPLGRIKILDDFDYGLEDYPDNLIPVKGWYGEPTDQVLLALFDSI